MALAKKAPKVWLSLPPDEIDGLPDGPDYSYWNGEGELPSGIEEVEFFVPPYLKGPLAVPLLPRMRNLRVVQTLTAGVDNLLPHIPEGVTLCNARGVHDASTAELTLALILASLRGIPRFVRGQDTERWYAGFYPALADRTVLIVGYGAIGEAIEERLVPFECDVVRVARSARATPRGPVRSLSDLPHLLPQADVVVLVTPLTRETEGMVDATFLGRLKDGALVVNVARGAIMDTKALLVELESGRLNAALDVTDPEPLPAGHPLWHAPNTLISPHVGGSTSAFRPRAERLVIAQLNRYLTGESLENVIVMS
ncbi:2-hydroxyacid dehydrogenase [Wenjunlia tyrosinilytica]|uniref:Dehydrogenase n=1 Tax=Wenjunlia tyrosinilytica TaxID=1544741 RepID=A0A918E0F0_9ACTN|nr:2-hydroxyacid dehydrogenase [Wenjunlia tyrosinilytica]GGO93022.1 dehydrogenase [Wenjunlia tyrosinilytica]